MLKLIKIMGSFDYDNMSNLLPHNSAFMEIPTSRVDDPPRKNSKVINLAPYDSP